jgi:hypothetical protein
MCIFIFMLICIFDFIVYAGVVMCIFIFMLILIFDFIVECYRHIVYVYVSSMINVIFCVKQH